MKKLLSLLIALSSTLFAVWAQDKSIHTPKQLVENSSKQLIQGAKIGFTTAFYTAEGNMQQEFRGNLLLSGKKFRIRYDRMDGCYNGTLFSLYNGEENTFTIMQPSTEEVATINPLSHFLYHPQEVRYKELPGKKGTRIIGVYPNLVREGIKHYEVSFSLKDNVPTEIVGIFADGSRLIMVLKSISYSAIPKQEFEQSQKQYPNSELVDLR